jgi:hypothetical protein
LEAGQVNLQHMRPFFEFSLKSLFMLEMPQGHILALLDSSKVDCVLWWWLEKNKKKREKKMCTWKKFESFFYHKLTVTLMFIDLSRFDKKPETLFFCCCLIDSDSFFMILLFIKD